MATRKVRYKKLNIKTALPVLREDQVDPSEYEALTTETQIATGVEQAEENEYHLQVVLQGAAASSDNEIPVPPPQESDINTDSLYARKFQQPANYIRFSQTVEECVGCQYDMTEEDDVFLKTYNEKRSAKDKLSEDGFEQIMEVFEETASISTPFASVDKTIAPYDHMVPGLNVLQVPKVMHHAKDIYEYWKSQRQTLGGSIHPSLKFETHQETDEMDPFVCFRRREVRQTRKTRARDVQSADKLKKLRRELEDGRQLVIHAHEREIFKRDLLLTDHAVYDERHKLKQMKIRLGIKTDDEDLVNQKPQKKKAPDLSLAQRAPGTQVRAPARTDGRQQEMELVLLVDSMAKKEKELRDDVVKRIDNHCRWNEHHVDLTCEPLPPVKGENIQPGFRTAKTQYLMTPPASEDSNEDEPTAMEVDEPEKSPVFFFHGAPAEVNDNGAPHLQFRRRIGRLNRLWIDRRRLPSPPRELSPPPSGHMDVDMETDRWKYDNDDSDDEPDVITYDPYGTRALKFRSTLPLSWPYPMRRQELATGRPNGLPQQGRPSGQPRPAAVAAAAAAATAAASATPAAAGTAAS